MGSGFVSKCYDSVSDKVPTTWAQEVVLLTLSSGGPGTDSELFSKNKEQNRTVLQAHIVVVMFFKSYLPLQRWFWWWTNNQKQNKKSITKLHRVWYISSYEGSGLLFIVGEYTVNKSHLPPPRLCSRPFICLWIKYIKDVIGFSPTSLGKSYSS